MRKKSEVGKLTGINIKKPTIQVNHKDLKRYGDDNCRSVCPKCEKGVLLVGRNSKTFKLQKYDNCILCGQQYEYMDIDELRSFEEI